MEITQTELENHLIKAADIMLSTIDAAEIKSISSACCF